jgi:hypothetical protein
VQSKIFTFLSALSYTLRSTDRCAPCLLQYLLLGQPMSDVAIAEGDAGKGEIVISPIVHRLLHQYTSQRYSPRRPGSSRKPAEQENGHAGDNSAQQHPLTCGCERTPSGYYKIHNTLEDMLCNVDFSTPEPVSTTATEEVSHDAAELQYEFDTYAQIVEELMAGFKAVTPHLRREFADVIDKCKQEEGLSPTAEAGEWTP